ncbi:Maltase 1 [Habropoda laboriosa]|uniref:alpha-glucosidase n=2 Tax=Habropoda laboriosa TaxID=597456 RepID=A0A0L7RG77_9HYME|nr:Maltase 1 [Habropoda laboriosa]
MKSFSVVVLVLLLGLAAGEIKNKGWWKNAVFYQVYPRSFMDSNGDGTGDLEGIRNKLQHFKDTGITGIWLSPINKSPMVDFGYDISDFRDVDPIFGNLDNVRSLLKDAKALGIKVILDLVPNHTSDQHTWFQQSLNRTGKYTDYYIWSDGKKNENGTMVPPNNWVSVFNGTGWTLDKRRNQFYFHQFYYQQPDLNYTNPDVQNEMKEIIKYWLDIGMDGFRIDAVPHLFEGDITKDEPAATTIPEGAKPGYDHVTLNHTITKDQPETYELMKSWREFVDKYADERNQTEKVLLTEAYTSWDNTLKYYNYGSNVPFNFKFITDADAKSNAKDFKMIIDRWIQGTPKDGVSNWVMGNHDRVRIATRYPGRADHMVMLEMILPGVAVTYYGEEIGMEDNSTLRVFDFRDGCRTPFQWDGSANAGFSKAKETWLPVHSNYKSLNLEQQKNTQGSHYNLYTELIKLRKGNVLTNGTVTTAVLNNDVLAVIREQNQEAVTLLMNFNQEKSVSVNLTGLVSQQLNQIKLKSTGAKATVG